MYAAFDITPVDQMEGFLKSVDQTVDQTPLKVKEG